MKKTPFHEVGLAQGAKMVELERYGRAWGRGNSRHRAWAACEPPVLGYKKARGGIPGLRSCRCVVGVCFTP